jgi:hypothetical protein
LDFLVSEVVERDGKGANVFAERYVVVVLADYAQGQLGVGNALKGELLVPIVAHIFNTTYIIIDTRLAVANKRPSHEGSSSQGQEGPYGKLPHSTK